MWIRSSWNPIILSLRWTDNAIGVSNAFWNNFWINLTRSKMHQRHRRGGGTKKNRALNGKKRVLSAHIYVCTYSNVAFDIVSWPVTLWEKIVSILFILLDHYCFSQHINHVLIYPAIHLHARTLCSTNVEPIVLFLGCHRMKNMENSELEKKLEGNKKEERDVLQMMLPLLIYLCGAFNWSFSYLTHPCTG